MRTVRPPPSPTPSDGRPVCRICLGPDENVYRLIRPCRCRGTIALVHPNCLTTWVTTSHKQVCQTCTTEFEMEPGGELKNMCEWSSPRALSQQPQDEADFNGTAIWMIYLFYLGYVYMRSDVYEMKQWMDFHIKLMYSILLIDNFLQICVFSFYLAKFWHLDNSIYKIVDRSTVAERNNLDELQIHPFTCAVCPNGVEKISPIIYPCNCRNNNNRLHNECLVTIAEQMKIDPGWYNLGCAQCMCQFEKEPIRMKKSTEWKWHRPLSQCGIDRLGIARLLCFLCYFSRTVYIWKTTEGDEMRNAIFDLASTVCWMEFWYSMIYCGRIAVLVMRNWIKENSIFKFKERNLSDRESRTEMKTARSR